MKVRWFVNDASLQGQFYSIAEFEPALRELLDLRKSEPAYSNLYVTRAFGDRPVLGDRSLAHTVQNSADRDFRLRVLQWLNQRGPFLDDDRLPEENDYFECLGMGVTDQGLGEAARRIIRGFAAGTWSFIGGAVNFARTPLSVDHGIPGDLYGTYDVPNVWESEAFRALALGSLAEPKSWSELVTTLRLRFPQLDIPDIFFNNQKLQAEPYESSIGDRVQELCRHLNEYVLARGPNGEDTERTNELVRTLFSNASGAVPLFTGESSSNQDEFREEMTFVDPDNPDHTIFAHWHGKVKHRYFRMHFEWPVPRQSKRLKVLYLGPKLTKG